MQYNDDYCCSLLQRLLFFPYLLGVKFLVTTDPAHLNVDAFIKRVYEVYADYVMKNPFQTLDMPIHSELFDLQLQRLIPLFPGDNNKR